MNPEIPTLNKLFKQLGLEDSDEAIDRFIDEHSPLAAGIALSEAPFWNASQADFIKQAISEDSLWAVIVDDLNERMRP